MLACIAAIGFAASARSGLLGLFAGTVVFAGALAVSCLKSLAKSRRTFVLVILLIATTAACGISGSKRFAEFGTDSASIGRIILWADVTWKMLPHMWSTGAGPGMFRAAFAQYRSPDYGLSGPDVHWESAHNIFLDRFSEQGVWGLAMLCAMSIAFFINMRRVLIASPDWRKKGLFAATTAGFAGGLISSFFNGEVISTTFLFYLWVALSFSLENCFEFRRDARNSKERLPGAFRFAVLTGAMAISAILVWHAGENWMAESHLIETARAAGSHDTGGVLVSARKMEQDIAQTGTYSLEAGLITSAFLRENYDKLNDHSRVVFAQAGIDASLRAMTNTDRPMVALLNLAALGDVISDARTPEWLVQLNKIDPQWFRAHDLSARWMLRHGRYQEARREAAIAHELAPYVQTTTELWRQLLALQQ
jgi:hypothetical protein